VRLKRARGRAMGLKPERGEIFDYFLEGGMTGLWRLPQTRAMRGIHALLGEGVDAGGGRPRRAHRELTCHSLAISHGATRARTVATLLGLAVILIADATPNGPMANLRNWVFDAYERSWPASRPENRILVIDIDDDSIRHIGQWPWSRDRLARLVEMAAAARVIGIDLLLTEPDRLSGNSHETDAILAASLRKVPVVLAAAANPSDELRSQPMPTTTPVFEAGDDPRAALPHYRSVAWPREAFTDAASGTSLITVPPDSDGVIRKMPTVASVGSGAARLAAIPAGASPANTRSPVHVVVIPSGR
jgi:CHASE2 domain